MNTNFSFHRIRLLLKADWIEHKKNFLVSMGVLLLAWLFILFITNVSGNDVKSQLAILGLGGFITLIYYCKHINRKIYKGKGQFFITPASQPEKYTLLLLEGLVYFLTLYIIFCFGLIIKALFVSNYTFMGFSEYISAFLNTNGSELGIFFFSSLIFLSYITFQKHALFIAFAGIFAYISLFAYILFKFFSGITDAFQDYHESSYIFDAFQTIAAYYKPVMIISTLVILVVGYFKLKEKELR